eukprot:6563547-Prymnesium_polylepis.1
MRAARVRRARARTVVLLAVVARHHPPPLWQLAERTEVGHHRLRLDRQRRRGGARRRLLLGWRSRPVPPLRLSVGRRRLVPALGQRGRRRSGAVVGRTARAERPALADVRCERRRDRLPHRNQHGTHTTAR